MAIERARFSIFGVAMGLLAACGGGGAASFANGSGTVSGTVTGYPITSVAEVGSAAYVGAGCPQATGTPPAYEAALFIYLSSSAGVCSAYLNSGTQPSGTSLLIAIETAGSTPQAAIGPGTYQVNFGANTTAPIMVAGVGPNGCSANGDLSGSGSVTITSVSSSGASGSYNLTFVGSGGAAAGTLTGNFTAGNCGITNFCTASKSSC
jgi:hypothetical protein